MCTHKPWNAWLGKLDLPVQESLYFLVSMIGAWIAKNGCPFPEWDIQELRSLRMTSHNPQNLPLLFPHGHLLGTVGIEQTCIVSLGAASKKGVSPSAFLPSGLTCKGWALPFTACICKSLTSSQHIDISKINIQCSSVSLLKSQLI